MPAPPDAPSSLPPVLQQHRTKIQAWFFDLDGTLMDTDDQAVDRLAHRLRFLGSRRAARLARRLVMSGETPMNLAMTVFDAIGLDPWVFALRRRLSRVVKPTFRLVPGVTPLIAYLAPISALAVVTTRSRADADHFLAQHDLKQHFTVIATQETTKRLKPHPEPVLYAAAELGLPPAAVVMVGDTTVDILSARRAGAWSVGVLCGFGEAWELQRAGAHLVLDSTADLLPLLTQSSD
ncbi:MAG: HAD family hydrolase [Anaerolineae bacterium]|nr:HAD family hydrolase [Anaerolineae bacterium]